MLRAIIFTFFAWIFCAASIAHAGELASLSIISQQTGEPLKIWRHGGRNYVAAVIGQRYYLRLTNKSNERVLSVVAVDGINVITGATATPEQTGYVLGAWQQHDILGWRKDQHQVAAFYFTNVEDSYAARTGRENQTGVIGIAIYRERAERPEIAVISPPAPAVEDRAKSASESPRRKVEPSLKSEAAPVASMPLREDRLGTGHGERIASQIRSTSFIRATSGPNEVLTLYYDSYANLVARGIIPKTWPRYSDPQHPPAFPGTFVPDPA